LVPLGERLRAEQCGNRQHFLRWPLSQRGHCPTCTSSQLAPRVGFTPRWLRLCLQNLRQLFARTLWNRQNKMRHTVKSAGATGENQGSEDVG
jgi:hypothetical protein